MTILGPLTAHHRRRPVVPADTSHTQDLNDAARDAGHHTEPVSVPSAADLAFDAGEDLR